MHRGIYSCSQVTPVLKSEHLGLIASPTALHFYLASLFFLANQEKSWSNSLTSNLAFLASWEIFPSQRGYMPARIRVAIARRCEFGARPPAPTARHRPSPALAAFCCTAALCWKRVAAAVTLMLPPPFFFPAFGAVPPAPDLAPSLHDKRLRGDDVDINLFVILK